MFMQQVIKALLMYYGVFGVGHKQILQLLGAFIITVTGVEIMLRVPQVIMQR